MADRSILVELGLRADGFKREAASAADALDKVGDAGNKASTAGGKGFKSLSSQLRDNRQDAEALGVGLTAAGGGMLAYTASVVKTGTAYNSLQQNSRAALKVLLGGTEAASAQMERLNAFAKTSPFSKATFIEAQQQLISFGVSAERLIPILDAVQQSVAAMGGSNTDISQIVDILAKVQSQGKMTGRELMMLGIHGIDAAQLIGDAMGKTGNEIRNEITAGTLDATTAIDALVQGMQGRFGGAADAVKEQWTGAVDRVSAAWRDFSSSAMTPFINPEGGGLFVEWANDLADFMRSVDALPQGVKTASVVVGGLGGTALTAAGGFLLLAPRIMDTVDALNRMQSAGGALGTMSSLASTAGRAAGALAVVAGLMAATEKGLSPFMTGRPELEATTSALLDMETAGTGVDEMFNTVGRRARAMNWGVQRVRDMESAMNALINPNLLNRLDDFAGTVLSFGKRQGRVERDSIIKQFNAMGDALAQMVESGHGERAAEIYGRIESQWVEMGGSLEDLQGLMPAYDAALQGQANSAELAAGGMNAAAAAVENYKTALEALSAFQDAAADSFLAGRAAAREWEAATTEFSGTLNHTEESLDTYAAAARKAVQTMVEAVDANGQRIYSEDELIGKMQASRDVVLAAAEAMGVSSADAELLADNLGLIPEMVSVWVQMQDDASDEVAQIRADLDGLPPEVITQILAMDNASEVAASVKEALDRGVPPEKIVEVLADDHASLTLDVVDANVRKIPDEWESKLRATDLSSQKARAVKAAVDAIPGSKNVTITANDQASGTIQSIQYLVNSLTGKTITLTTNHVTNTVSSSSGGMKAVARASGGAIFGPGTETSDSIPAWLSHNEHVLSAAEVRGAGGHGAVFALRSMMRSGELRSAMGFAGGGTPAVVSPLLVPQAPVSVGAPSVTVFVENPFTGAEVDARVKRTVVEFGGGR